MAQKHDTPEYVDAPMTRAGTLELVASRRQIRSDAFTAARWAAVNPILQLGEMGYETDTNKLKVGDGVTAWTDLGYVGGSDDHNKGYYTDLTALQTAYPTGEDGDYAIVGSTDTVWVWDSGTSAWVDSDQKGQVVSVNSKTGTVVLDAFDVDAVAQFETMPTASQANAGKVVQYIGATSASYTNGYFYKNIATTTASSATASQTAGSSLTDVAVVVATFETQITTSGSYVFTSDGADWSYDGNVVDLTDYGITYTGTPVADDAITVVYTAESTSYAWGQVDVQPAPEALPDQTGQSGKFLTTDGTDASWGTISTIPMSYTNLSSTTPSATSTGDGAVIAIGGGAVARGASSGGGETLVIGNNAECNNMILSLFGGCVVGQSAQTNKDGVTIFGNHSSVYGSNFATVVGYGLSTNNGGIMLGADPGRSITGTGGFDVVLYDSNTYHSNLFTLLTVSGIIPTARLADTTNAQQGQVLTLDSNLNAVWQAGGGGGGGGSYTAGNGISIDANNEISVTAPTLVNSAVNSASLNIGGDESSIVSPGSNNTLVGKNTSMNNFCGYTTVVGDSANGATGGVFIGCQAFGTSSGLYGTAIGYQAGVDAQRAIQLGAGQTNSDANTFKVANANGNFEMMNANGNLPADRLASTTGLADGNYRLRLVVASGVPTLSWVAE